MSVDEVSVSHSSGFSSRKPQQTVAQYETVPMVTKEETTTTTRGVPVGYQTDYTKTVTTTTTTEQQQHPPATTAGAYGVTRLPEASYRLPENAYEASTRKVSSVILESTPLSQPKTDQVRYVEVPTIEEQVTYVTVKETREIEKKVDVPNYVYDVQEEIVEVPEYVDQYVDKPVVEWVTREKKVPQIVDRYVDVPVTHVVKRQIPVTKTREVPGQVIQRKVPYNVEVKKQVVRHSDTDVPVIVAQTVRPIITESDRKISVDVLDYEPEVVPVDVHVAKPVSASVETVGRSEARHRLVNITSGQYNTILKLLNQHMDPQTRSTLPYVAENDRVPFIPDHEAQFIIAPPDITVENWNRPIPHGAGASAISRPRGESVMETTGQEPRGNICCGNGRRTKTQPEGGPTYTTVQTTTTTTQQYGAPAPSTMSHPTMSQHAASHQAPSQQVISQQPTYTEPTQLEPVVSQQGSYVVESQGPTYVSKQPEGFVGQPLEGQSNLSFKPVNQTKRSVCC